MPDLHLILLEHWPSTRASELPKFISRTVGTRSRLVNATTSRNQASICAREGRGPRHVLGPCLVTGEKLLPSHLHGGPILPLLDRLLVQEEQDSLAVNLGGREPVGLEPKGRGSNAQVELALKVRPRNGTRSPYAAEVMATK